MSGLITNHEWTRMDTNSEKLLLKGEVFQVVGCAIEVLNALGHGLVEKADENALVIEFLLRKIPFRQLRSYDVLYKGHKIGSFVPDLIVFDTLVVDTKVIDRITDHERGLMLNYPHYRSACWSHPQLQAQEIGMGEDCLMKFVSIRVHSWLPA
jgi:GxxExxY protein